MASMELDPLYKALVYFRQLKYEKCAECCEKALEKNAFDQAAWVLKAMALTRMVYVDDLEIEEEGIAEALLDDNSIAQVPRPGTSLKTSCAAQGANPMMRPVTQSGRPITGMVRPGTQGAVGSIDAALKSTRTAMSARPVTSSLARYVRMGTASMLSQVGQPFINVARLNISKYGQKPALAKALFNYIYYHENEIRHALELAAQATQSCKFEDWWWKLQLGKCYYRLAMFRDAEKQFRSANTQQPMVETALWLGKLFIRLDQPLAALELYRMSLESFSNDTLLLTAVARIHEGLNDLSASVKFYKDVLSYDSVSVEAIACIATNHFYSDQPEVALRFYRRLLQMGLHTAEVYNNIALCCFYAQQFDLSITCVERALQFSRDDTTTADVWYNMSHIAINSGDKNLAVQCLRLAIAHNNDHAESHNNLGVLLLDRARVHFDTSVRLATHLFEPRYNLALLSDMVGDCLGAYNYSKMALDVFPNHVDSKIILERVYRKLASL
ncbi:tetratricopeptide repeat protein 8-like [Tropilaelaps mercedesae]|uniref:Tetratricopeptide repeat protein 8-like n=1 Tax=Tropilaelaps mercedesae TaxID=418985 RepID=A0A1V9XD22_9ACAR|nr:tetratricopeptide repeat protein 8-like [Tropilaelaps mercedesae]